jgi:hypothetical protein
MWWNGILARENERRLVDLRKEMDEAHAEINFWRATNVHGISADDMVKLDRCLRDADHRFWRAFHAYQDVLKSTPS